MLGKSAIALAIAIAAGAPVQAADPLAQVSQDWAKNWQARDLEATLSLYTDDAVFLDPSATRVTGKAALRAFFATVLKQYGAKPRMQSVTDGSSGDLGFDSGTYTEVITPIANPSGAIRTHGSYLVVLRRVGGRWLIAQQMWTGSAPVSVRK